MKRKLFVLIMLVASIIFAYLAYVEHKPFEEAKIRHDALVKIVAEEIPENSEALDRYIDFESLKKINPEIIGWIYIPQVGVDEPILKGTDDEFYLTHDFEGNYSPLGSVFTWSDGDEMLEDPHMCLFGHNMMSGQIFGQLNKFKDVDFLNNNPDVYIYTPYRSKKLKAKECYTCNTDDEIFQNGWKDDDEQVFTLVTCDGYDDTPVRLVVNCVLFKEKLRLS